MFQVKIFTPWTLSRHGMMTKGQLNSGCVKSFSFFVDCFYIALFSTLRQTQCTRMQFCMSEQLFIVHF